MALRPTVGGAGDLLMEDFFTIVLLLLLPLALLLLLLVAVLALPVGVTNVTAPALDPIEPN